MTILMWNIYILIFLITTTLLLFLLPRRKPGKNLPPGPPGLPLFGNLLQLGSHPHRTLAKWTDHYGPLISLRFGLNPTVVASSAELAREILHKNDKNFVTHPIPDSIACQPNCEGTIAWVPGDQWWRNKRRICNTLLFNDQRLDHLQHLRDHKVHQLVAHIRKNCDSGKAVDIGKLSFATTLNLISNTIFSVDMVDPKFESAGEFKNLVWRIMEYAGKPNVSDYFPLLKRLDLQGIRRYVVQSYHRLHEIFDELIDERMKSRSKGLRSGDFLEVLLDHCEEDGSQFTRETIKPMIVDLFIAGSDTSGITTEWAMAETLKNPEIMQKARQEISSVIGNTAFTVKESDLEKLPYIQAIVKETLRLHPAAPLLLPYMAENDAEIGGFTVPRGHRVLVNAWAISRDPKYWEDPLCFKPERFLDSTMDYKGRDFEYIPFGAGRRICPGLPLANRMVPTMVASLIHCFNWELPTENIDMQEEFGITLKMAVPLVAFPRPK